MTCNNCGAEVSPYANKCSHCGAKIQHNEEEVYDYQSMQSADKQRGRMEMTLRLEGEDTKEKIGTKEKTGKKEEEHRIKNRSLKRDKRYLSIALIVILTISACGVKWYTSKNKYVQTEGIVYTKENEMRILYPDTNKTEVLANGTMPTYISARSSELGFEDSNSFLQYTSDKSKMVYQGDIEDEEMQYQTLYYKENKIGAKKHIIALNVNSFTVTSEDKVVYLDKDSSVYLYDMKKKSANLLATDVLSFDLDETRTYIVYYSNSDEICIQDIKQEMEPINISSEDIWFARASKDLKKIVYMEDGKLYLLENFTEQTVISENVAAFECLLNQDAPEIFYYEKPEETLSYYTFIEDKMLEKDQNMKKPKAYDYSWGENDDAYIADLAEYNQKEIRDSIREALKSDVIEGGIGKLYHYSEGKTEQMEENAIISAEYVSFMGEDIPFTYSVQEEVEIEKIPFEANLRYQALHDAAEKYYTTTYLESVNQYSYLEGRKILLPKSQNSRYQFDLENKWIYIGEVTSEDKPYSKLRRLSYDDKSMGEIEECFEKEGEYYLIDNRNGFLLLQLLGEEGSSYCLWTKEGGLFELNSYGVLDYTVKQSEEDNYVMYIDVVGRRGKLFLLGKDGMPVELCDNVCSFYVKSKNEIYLITDYESAKKAGTLKLYTGSGESTTLDEEVSHLMFETHTYYYEQNYYE